MLQHVWRVNGGRINGLQFAMQAHPLELAAALSVLADLTLIAVDDGAPEPVYLPAYPQHQAAAEYHAAHGGQPTELFVQRYARHACQSRAFTLMETIPLVASVKPNGRVTDTLYNYLSEIGATSPLREDLPELFDEVSTRSGRAPFEDRIVELVQGGLGGWLVCAYFEVDTPGTLPFRTEEAYGETFLRAFDLVSARVLQHRAAYAQVAS